ncbi:phosphatidylglycerophosphatase [Mobiluncus mulieris]|nr:phosphatidylglycerophosphatase [Mobiluncus mulieris]
MARGTEPQNIFMTESWLVLLVGFAGWFCWLVLLVGFAGWFCWLVLLVGFAGWFCWLVLLVVTGVISVLSAHNTKL